MLGGTQNEHCINQISKQLSLHQKQPCTTLGVFGYDTMDAGIPNTSTKSTGDIAVLQPNDQKPNQHNVNSDTTISQLVHTGFMSNMFPPTQNGKGRLTLTFLIYMPKFRISSKQFNKIAFSLLIFFQ